VRIFAGGLAGSLDGPFNFSVAALIALIAASRAHRAANGLGDSSKQLGAKLIRTGQQKQAPSGTARQKNAFFGHFFFWPLRRKML